MIISFIETIEVRYLLAISFIFLNFLTAAQNLYIGSGGHLSLVKSDVSNEYFVNRTSLSSGTKSILDKYQEASLNFSYISLLYEKEITIHFSFKSGIYLHTEKGSWTESFMEWRIGPGSWREHYITNVFSLSNIDIPFLLSYNLFDRGRNINTTISFGPYIGYGYDLHCVYGGDPSVPAYLYPLDYGLNVSAGFSFKKWNFCCYYLKGLRNSVKRNILYNDKLKEVKSNIFGISLSRIIHFSKKRQNPKENIREYFPDIPKQIMDPLISGDPYDINPVYK